MSELVGVNGQPLDPGKENVKQSIFVIEEFCFILNQCTIPAKMSQGFLKGFSFLNQMHNQLLAQLTPEEIEEMKKAGQKQEAVN